jgi:hypothetical protein
MALSRRSKRIGAEGYAPIRKLGSLSDPGTQAIADADTKRFYLCLSVLGGQMFAHPTKCSLFDLQRLTNSGQSQSPLLKRDFSHSLFITNSYIGH